MPVSTTTTTTTTTTALPLKTSSLPKPSSRHHIDTTNGKKSIAGQQEQQKERQEQQQEHTVHVALRVRPTENANDTFKTRGKVITIAPFQKSFAFDHVFESQSTQEQVFRGTTKDLIGQVINGRNATLLAYGERATGKSYTLGCTLNSYEDPAYEGIIPRAAAALFDRLQRPGQTLRPASTFTTSSSSSSSSLRSPNPTQSTSASARLRPVSMVGPPRRGSSPNLTNGTNGPRYAVRISFAEVHDDKLVDLLCSSADSNKLPFDRSVRNAQQSVHGIKEVAVRNTGDILRYLESGVQASSSQQKHTVFTIILSQEKWVNKKQQQQQQPPSSKIPSMIPSKSTPSTKSSSGLGAFSSAKRRVSTLNVKAMVGQMEKQARSPSKQPKEDEGEWVAQHSKLHFVDVSASSNCSMDDFFSVPDCFSSSSGKKDSRLTRLIQGSATISLLACIGAEDLEGTEKTVKYACRARNNKVDSDYHYCEEWMKNDDPSFLRETIARLQAQVRTLKNDDKEHEDQDTSSVVTSRQRHISSSSCSSAHSDRVSVCPSSSARTTITIPDTNSEADAQETLLADLRQQIEELQNEVAVTRERNRFVEKELTTVRRQQSSSSIAPESESFDHDQRNESSKSTTTTAAMMDANETVNRQERVEAAAELSSLKELKASLARSIEREQAINAYIDAIEQKLSSLTTTTNDGDVGTANKSMKDASALAIVRQIKQTFQKSDGEAIKTEADGVSQELLQSLKDAVQNKTGRILELEKELTAAETLRKELVKLREEQSIQIKQLSGSLASAKSECSALQDKLDHEQMRSQELQTQSTQTIEVLESKLQNLTISNSHYELEIQDMKSKAKELQQHMWDQEKGTQLTLRNRFEELERVKLDLNSLQQVEEKQNLVICTLDVKLDKMELLTQTLRQQLVEREAYIENLVQENKEKTQLLEDAQRTINDVLRDVNKIGQDRKQLDMTVQVLEGTLRHQEDSLAKSTDQLHDLERLYSVQSAELEEKQQCIADLESKKQQLEGQLQSTTTKATESDNKARQLETEVANIQAALQQQISNVNRLEEGQMQTEIELQRTKALESRVMELDEELAKIHSDREVQTATDSSTTTAQDAAASDVAAAFDDVDIRAIITGLESRLHVLQQAQRSDQDEFDVRFERAVAELEETQKTNRDQQQTIEALEASIKDIQARLDETNASHAEKCREIEALHKQLDDSGHDSGSEVSSLGSSDLLRQISETGHTTKAASQQQKRSSTPTTEPTSPTSLSSNNKSKEELLNEFREKLQDSRGQEELLKKLAHLAENNAQLVSHVTDLEGQISLQRSKMSLETKNLELEVIRLTSSKNRLEKEMEQIVSSRGSSKRGSSGGRDSIISVSSPPQTPRVMSPTHRDSRIPKSGSLRSLAEEEFSNGKRVSQRSSRTRTASASIFPPPTAPPSNPLPPVPTALPPLPTSASSPPLSPTRSVSSPLLHRQNSNTTVSASEITVDDASLTSDRYERIVKSMQRKMRIAENDVRAHQDVISKLESQLSRSEHMVREVKKQLDVLSREKQASNIEIQNLRSQVTQVRTQHQSAAMRTAEEYKTLEEELAKQRQLKEKAEKARLILENRMEELMSKKNKFMCF